MTALPERSSHARSPRTRSSRTGRVAALVAVAAIAALGVAAALVPGSSAAYVAKVTNSNDTAATAPYFTCAAAAAGDKGTAFFQYALNEASGTSAVDASGNARTGTYQGGLTTSTTTPLSCSRDTGGAATFNGAGQYVSTPTQLTASPVTFTMEVWFKSTVASGMLLGWGNQQTGLSGNYDRHLYFSTTGQLAFGVYNGATNVITSPLKYNDGAWHQAVVTFSAATGSAMYVDGKLVVSNSAYTVGENHAGYWRIGYDNLAGWPNTGTDYYFTGSMRFAAVYTSVLSATQIANHYAAGQ